jgi:hypothetical protein
VVIKKVLFFVFVFFIVFFVFVFLIVFGGVRIEHVGSAMRRQEVPGGDRGLGVQESQKRRSVFAKGVIERTLPRLPPNPPVQHPHQLHARSGNGFCVVAISPRTQSATHDIRQAVKWVLSADTDPVGTRHLFSLILDRFSNKSKDVIAWTHCSGLGLVHLSEGSHGFVCSVVV